MTGATPDQVGREVLRQVRSMLRWKRIDMGGSILLATVALGGGATMLAGSSPRVIGLIGVVVGVLLGGLGGLMLSGALDAWREVQKLVGGDLPRARVARWRVARAPDPAPKNLV